MISSIMGVNKIVYVTPGESHRGELTSSAELQFRKIVGNVLEGNMGDLIKVFRTTKEDAPITEDSLIYLSNKCRKTSDNIGERLYNNLGSRLDIF